MPVVVGDRGHFKMPALVCIGLSFFETLSHHRDIFCNFFYLFGEHSVPPSEKSAGKTAMGDNHAGLQGMGAHC